MQEGTGRAGLASSLTEEFAGDMLGIWMSTGETNQLPEQTTDQTPKTGVLLLLGLGGLRAGISKGIVPDMLREWPFWRWAPGPEGTGRGPRFLMSLDRRFCERGALG